MNLKKITAEILRLKAEILHVFRKETSLFRGRPVLWLAALVIVLIPSIYTVIYIYALWDPYGSMGRLPAGFVNLDGGSDYKGKNYNLGDELVGEVTRRDAFRFVAFYSEAEAERAVRSGSVYFALVVPPDFSRKAVPGEETVSLRLITSQGTSYIASLFADRFSREVVESVNHELGVERWKVVLSSGKDAAEATGKLKEGAAEALSGARKLEEGLGRAAEGAAELKAGQDKLAAGLGKIDTRKLVALGAKLHENTSDLAAGLARAKLLDSLTKLPSPKELEELASGAADYQKEIDLLANGLNRISSGARALAEKEGELAGGVEELKEGGAALVKGLDTLRKGMSQFAAALPSGPRSAERLAASVTLERQNLAPVSSNGPAFTPYFMALSLWLGVLVSSFLFHLVVFPRSVADKGKAAKLLGKGLLPFLISLAGAGALGLTVQLVMRIPQVHVFGFYVVLLVAVATYSTIVFALVRIVGDAGKLLAVLLLVVQIAAAGGAYPIELSPRFYRMVSPWLPLTRVVEGLRAAMFGSYDGDWARYVLCLLPWIAVSLGLSLLSTRRFRYVADETYAPALDLPLGRRRRSEIL